MTKEEIRRDFLAFADDDSDVLFETNGDVLYHKNGTEHICNIKTDDTGRTLVEFDDEKLPYRTFIAKHLARLDLFAKKIIDKRNPVEAFVDSPAILKTVHEQEENTALSLLQKECDGFLQFGTKINFITADAGHGKSALLKQYQYNQAERYLSGESSYIFWHVDLLGRDLVRLGEAIMFDLGELRLPGLYYPSIINLIQKRFIILAIDGFDELAAEIGGMNAASSLSNFLNEMAGQGTLIAASRRTFFDTHDYRKKSNLLKSKAHKYDVLFHELKLIDWTKDEVVRYFANCGYDNPEMFYNKILAELHDEEHPVLTRPFLLTKVAQAIDGDINQIPTFFSKKGSKEESVALIVESFAKREVDKWKGVDNKTGQPYLTFEQHIQLLSTLAKEMWEAKRDYVTLEEIEIHTTLLLEEWHTSEDIRQIIVRIVGSHAFMIPVSESKIDARKFDHQEFRNYFLSRALANLFEHCVVNHDYTNLKRFLYIDQLPDAVAMYCFNYVKDLKLKAAEILEALKRIIADEWKPTYLQTNIGTLLPFIIDKVAFDKPVFFDAKVNYSSLVFENKTIKNITFKNGNFINISLRNTTLENVHFVNCVFSKISIEIKAKLHFKNVSFSKSDVNSIVLLNNGEVNEEAYSPFRINELLLRNGIKIVDDNVEPDESGKFIDSEFKKALNKFLLKFNKMTNQYQKNIEEERYFGPHSDTVLNEVIPLLEKHKIIEEVDTKQSRQMGSKAWRLAVDIQELLKFDRVEEENQFKEFWHEANTK